MGLLKKEFRSPKRCVPRRGEPGRHCVAIYDLAVEITWHHFLVFHQGSSHKGLPRVKARGHGLHPLMAEWQGPGRACGKGNSFAAIFGKRHLPQSPRWCGGLEFGWATCEFGHQRFLSESMREISESSQYSLNFWGLLRDRSSPDIFRAGSKSIHGDV